MKFLKKIALSLGLVAITTPAPAAPADESWIGFQRAESEGDWIIIIDQWIATPAADTFPHCISIEFAIPPEQRQPNGMPDGERLARLEEAEDILTRTLPPSSFRHIINKTKIGMRTIGLCAKYPGVANHVESVLTSANTLAYRIVPSSLLEFRSYLPTHTEQMIVQNGSILAKLRENGDDGSQPRQIDHLINFNGGSDRTAVRTDLTRSGYLLGQEDANGLEFSMVTPLNAGQADEFVRYLNGLCEKNGCEYDGWATPVVPSQPD